MTFRIATIISLLFIVTAGAQTTAPVTATEFELKQNFPNPFNASTTVEFTLPTTERVQIDLFDLLGNRLRTLLDEERPAGSHSIVVRLEDLPTGFYFYQLQAGAFREMRRMTLLR